MAIADYSTTAASNTSISGIDIAENCSPAGMNNAIRQAMADIKTWYDAINFVDDITASAAELNILDGATLSTAELNVLDGIPGTLTATELGYVDGVTSAIQTQLNAKQASGATLTAFEALSLVAGDTFYATGADTPVRLAIGTAGQVLKVNSGATAPEWGAPSSPVTTETITLSGADDETTVAFVAGYSYRFKIRGASHDNGSGQSMTVQLYGDTAAAYGTARAICDGFTLGRFLYGEFVLYFPMTSSNVHSFLGHAEDSATNSASDISMEVGDGGKQGNITHWATAQTCSKVKFAWTGGSSDAGTIIVERF